MSKSANFLIEQYTTNCISQFAYYIESQGESAVIDPLRHSADYLSVILTHKSKLKYIFLTHFHADFVSGHINLAKKTGAKIVLGPTAKTNFDAYIAKDLEILKLGNIGIQILHTPGHTLESSCYILRDEEVPKFIFTGDTLFLGDAGRPDLSVDSSHTREELASLLFDSLKKIKALPDEVVIYPGHGSGSPCGKSIQKGTSCIIGNQKKSNYALVIESKEDFISKILMNIDKPPSYFFKAVAMNKSATIDDREEILKKSFVEIPVIKANELLKNNEVFLLDSREVVNYREKHIKGSVNVPLSSQYAIYSATILLNKKIIVVADPGRAEESIIRLTLVGLDDIVGYLKDGIDCDMEKISSNLISPQQLIDLIHLSNSNIIDVRSNYERENVKIEKSTQLFLNDLVEKYESVLDKDKEYQVLCKTGIRATIASSFLEHFGYKVFIIEGGMDALSKTDIDLIKKAE